MNSAIIGDSPIMLILAKHLKQKENLTLYTDKENVGGAWSYIKFRNVKISRQTNVVVPVDEKVAAHFLPMIPLFPTPEIIIFPSLQLRIALTIFAKASLIKLFKFFKALISY